MTRRNLLRYEDRQKLGAILMKAGYAARIGSERRVKNSTRTYSVEFWKEDDDVPK